MSGTILDDDTHTLNDGALQRFLRMRKWMVLTSVLLFLIAHDVVDFDAVRSGLAMPLLSPSWLHFVLSLTCGYQAVQAVLMFMQVVVTYSQSLRQRIGKHPEDYAAVKTQTSEMRAEHEHMKELVFFLPNRRAELRELEDLMAQRSAGQTETGYWANKLDTNEISAQIMSLQQSIADAEKKISAFKSRAVQFDSELRVKKRLLGRYDRRLLLTSWPEVIIDWMRILPSLIAIIYAALFLTRFDISHSIKEAEVPQPAAIEGAESAR